MGARLAVVMLTYGSTALLGGSGFLAVYVAGMAMGNREFLHEKSLMRFHDAIAWLAQISMFLVLGLLVFPSQLPAVAGRALLVAAALVLVARPLAVFLALAPTRLAMRARAMVSWVGLRGAVPIILATYPLEAVFSDADTSLHELTIPADSPVVGRQLVEIGLPAGALVVLLSRDGEFVVPQGGTVLRGGDEALVLADAETLPRVRTALDGSGSRDQPPC